MLEDVVILKNEYMLSEEILLWKKMNLLKTGANFVLWMAHLNHYSKKWKG
jgi:hypothetical protein